MSQLADRMNAARQGINPKVVTKEVIHKMENEPNYRVSANILSELIQALELQNPQSRWELKQIYKNAGFVFNQMLAIGRKEASITENEIQQVTSPVKQASLQFSYFIAQGKSQEAYHQAQNAYKAYQENPSEDFYLEKLIGNIGTALLAMGQDGRLLVEEREDSLRQAVSWFEKVLEIVPSSAFFTSQLGHVYFTLANSFSESSQWEKSPDWQQAIKYFTKAVEEYDPASDMDIPKLQETCFYLGYAHIVKKQYSKANFVINMALFLAGELSPLGLYLKACLLAQKYKNKPDKVEEVFRYLNKAIILDKSIKSEAKHEKLMEPLSTHPIFKKITRSR